MCSELILESSWLGAWRAWAVWGSVVGEGISSCPNRAVGAGGVEVGEGQWGQVPFPVACPSVTAGPTGTRAELFVLDELLQPRER